MSRARQKSVRNPRFYCSVNATRQGHKLKEATKEESVRIFRVYHKDESQFGRPIQIRQSLGQGSAITFFQSSQIQKAPVYKF